jgi:molybdopterin synthase catalytic subunit
MVRLVREPIDVQSLRETLRDAGDGAVVVFEGVVRKQARNRTVRHLEYHAYEIMALTKLEEICENARRQFEIREIGIVHRLGRLQPGECSVAIAVSSRHREPAFQACRFAIDSLKKVVPIWKKEYYEDGECWVESGN